MSAEKARALVIRLADFSESSRVVTLFSREFGQLSCLAKGAKRLRNPFESALDLLSECHIVFLRKSSGALHLLTEAQLIRRFSPAPQESLGLYGGYYIAELLEAFTAADDPHTELYDTAVAALADLDAPQGGQPAGSPDHRLTILRFELALLRETGQLPEFTHCLVCGLPIDAAPAGRIWVSQGGLLCSNCGRPEFDHTNISPGTLAVVRRLAAAEIPRQWLSRLQLTAEQWLELRRLVTQLICQTLGKRPKLLAYLRFR